MQDRSASNPTAFPTDPSGAARSASLTFQTPDVFRQALCLRVEEYFTRTGRKPRDCPQMYAKAERNLAGDPDGAARLQEFHRPSFATSGAMLRQEIERICGVRVCEASAEVEPGSGTVVKVFTTGARSVRVGLRASA